MKLRVDLDLVAPESDRYQWLASLRDLAASFPDAVLTVNGDSGSASLAMDDGLPDLVAPTPVERVAQDYALHRVQADLGDLPPALRASITEAINSDPDSKESLARLAAAKRCDDLFREQREECERRAAALASRLHAIGKIEPME